MGDAEGDDLGIREVMWVTDDFGGSLKEMRVASNSGHPFCFSGCMAIRHIAVETNPVVLVPDLKRVDRQIGGLYCV